LNISSYSFIIYYIFLLFIADWLKSTGADPSFEYLEKTDLADVLRKFYYAARSKDGQRYSKSAYKNIRAGLQRHLTSPPYKREMNLMQDKDFQAANQVYNGYMVALREEGKDISTNKEALLPGDIEKLYSKVFADNPQGLQWRMFYEIGIHFGRRGREGLRELRKDSFVVRTDDEGLEYIQMAYNEKEKTKRGGNIREKEKQAVMYAQPGDPNCPVRHFKDLLSKLNPNCEALYQRPKIKCFDKETGPWYDNCPVGVNTLSGMMKKMSQVGGLSKGYTNHCLRKTCVTALNEAGYEAKDIMSMTGHKHVSSLEPYLNATSMSKKKSMSEAIHQYHSAPSVPKKMKTAPETSIVPSTSDHGTMMKTPISEISNPPMRKEEAFSLNLQQSATNNTASSLFFGATFNNCQFNVHMK
jgi:integrase